MADPREVQFRAMLSNADELWTELSTHLPNAFLIVQSMTDRLQDPTISRRERTNTIDTLETIKDRLDEMRVAFSAYILRRIYRNMALNGRTPVMVLSGHLNDIIGNIRNFI